MTEAPEPVPVRREEPVLRRKKPECQRKTMKQKPAWLSKSQADLLLSCLCIWQEGNIPNRRRSRGLQSCLQKNQFCAAEVPAMRP